MHDALSVQTGPLPAGISPWDEETKPVVTMLRTFYIHIFVQCLYSADKTDASRHISPFEIYHEISMCSALSRGSTYLQVEQPSRDLIRPYFWILELDPMDRSILRCSH